MFLTWCAFHVPSSTPQRVVCCEVMSDCSVIPGTIACQAPLSMEFSRQEYWSGLPFPSPGDLPDLEIKPTAPMSPELAGGFFTTVSPGKTPTFPILRINF